MIDQIQWCSEGGGKGGHPQTLLTQGRQKFRKTQNCWI